MTDSSFAVVHVIRPEPDGSIGGADLHVLELAAAQAALALVRPRVFAPGHGQDFAHRAADQGVSLTSRPWQRSRDTQTIVHAHGYEADLIALLLVRARRPGKRRLPLVMTCHGIIEPDFRHRVLNAVDRVCLRRADVLIGVSEGAVRQLRRIAPDRSVHLVPNGVRAPRPVPDHVVRQVRTQLGVTNCAPLVGFVGRLSREKRPDLFLAVAEEVGARHETARFALIGGGALSDEIEAASARSAAGPRTLLAGLRHDMDAVFAALDVLVVPSDVENTPRVVLEGLARGVPVVVTAVGDMPLMVQDAPHTAVTPRGDHHALANSVLGLLGAQPALDRAAVTKDASTRTMEDMARAVQLVYAATTPPSGTSPVRT
ncbi:MAG: glycosyltransferase [Pseudonocardiales bacterium]